MAAKKDRVLWADDEIDLLKPHILFLQDKGYEVIPVISGQDAIECCKEESFDIIFLDENMPGLPDWKHWRRSRRSIPMSLSSW